MKGPGWYGGVTLHVLAEGGAEKTLRKGVTSPSSIIEVLDPVALHRVVARWNRRRLVTYPALLVLLHKCAQGSVSQP